MKFAFSEDQLLLRDTVRSFLEGECPMERVRALWDTETGRSTELWAQLAEIGLPGLHVPAAIGGEGLDEIDAVLLHEETGRAALAEPLISTIAVGVPLLRGLDDAEPGATWLPRVAAGEAILAVGHSINTFTSDAHVADLLLLPREGELHALAPENVTLTPQPANDPARRIFSIEWTGLASTRVAAGAEARSLLEAALDRGALACAAQLLGVTQALIDRAVQYAGQRKQFGVPIGSFQAVKHMLADLQVKLEYARPAVYRAAHSVAREARSRSVDVSMAKVAAAEAASAAAKTSLQVHGALGYTWEQDVHVWMRRAWSLAGAWGDTRWHRRRVARALLDDEAPAESFGYLPPAPERAA